MKNIDYITAGAGSGKTFTLTQKLLEFIDGGVKANEVILTTFTKLAAAEFKEKAREKLLEKGLFAEAVALESAQIGTVDSIANDFVAKYWYLLGRGAKSSVLSGADQKIYIKQSLSEVVTKEDLEVFSSIVAQFGYQTSMSSRLDDNFWQTHLEEIISFALQYNITDFKLSREKSCALIDNIFTTNEKFDIKEKVVSFIQSYLSQDKTAKSKVEKLQKILPAFKQSDNEAYVDIVKANSIIVSEFLSLKKPPENSNELHEILESVLQSKKYGKLLKTYVNRIFDIAQKWVVGDMEFKRQNNIIDYNDMERLFLQLLDNEEVKKEINGNYKIVFVDEFQDSSPLQIQIFDKLSEIVKQSIWVGDSKQAIYGFRGSDMSLVSAVSEKFSPDGGDDNLVECEPLKNSWRSREALVEFSNELFTPLFNYLKSEQVVLHPARAKDEAQFKESALMHWHLRDENITRRSKALAQKISELLDSKLQVVDKQSKQNRDIIPSDIAILCRANTGVSAVAEELKNVGLRVNCADISGDVVEVVLFKAIFSYLLNYRNDIAKATILHLTGKDMDVENLLSSRFDFLDEYEKDNTLKWATDNEFVSKIDALRDELKNQSLPELVENLVLNLDLMSFVKHYPNSEARVGNITRLMSKAKSYDDRCLNMGVGCSLLGFLQFLEEDDQEKVITKYKDAVNVMTYHKSKGLEWNMVVMTDLHRPASESWKNMFGVKAISVSEPSPENLYPERYVQLLPCILASPKSKLPVHIQDCIEQMDIAKSLHDYATEEAKRLLYVGVTRARDYLVLTSQKDDLKWLIDTGCKDEFFKFKDKNIPCQDLIADEDFEVKQAKETPKIPQKLHCELSNEPRYISPSKLHSDEQVELGELVDLGVKLDISAGSDMQAVGTKLHQLFCLYPSGSDDDKTIDALYGYLTKTYSEAVEVYAEAPISASENGQIIRGEIDLVWQTKSGYVVVDYKSFPGVIDSVLDEKSNHYVGKYAPQIKTYKKLLEKQGKKVLATLIYYAVQGVVVEVK